MKISYTLYPILDKETMRNLDQKAINEYGIKPEILMENAARSVVDIVLQNYEFEKCLILVGPGNNGGDGFSIARNLRNLDKEVVVLKIGKEYSKEAEYHFQLLKKFDVEVIDFNDTDKDLNKLVDNSQIIIDALFGIGLSRAMEDKLLNLVKYINANFNGVVVSVDIPSGISADTGLLQEAIYATDTVTFQYPKIGFFLNEAAKFLGEVHIVDIGLPNFEKVETNYYWIKNVEFIDDRSGFSHKGKFGKLGIIGGSFGMVGAPVLASLASYVCGAGLVYGFVPEKIASVYDLAALEAVTVPLPSTQSGAIDLKSIVKIINKIESLSINTLLIGPGLGNSQEVALFISRLVEELPSELNLIIDADAIRYFPKNLEKEFNTLIFTPHLGEFANSLDKDIKEVKNSTLDLMKEFLSKLKAKRKILVLKDVPTIIFDEDKYYVFLNPQGALAKAGSGDVLAGIISSFITQGLKPLAAVIGAVWLHNKTGKKAADRLANNSVLARELIREIPAILREGK